MKTSNVLIGAGLVGVLLAIFKKPSGLGGLGNSEIKSKAQVLKERSEYKKLINAVVSELGGTDSIADVNRGGADAGWPGFTYNSDTHKFAMKHRKDIVKMLEQMADDLGEDVVKMVSGFGVFRRSPMDNEDKRELYKYLGGGKNQQSTITNVMAWFALEEVCRMFED
jgi:hypothetical protein